MSICLTNDRVLQDLDRTHHLTATLQALTSESDFKLDSDAIGRSLHDVSTAMQEAQHQQLAIEPLSIDELQRVFPQLPKGLLTTPNMEMLITAPAHLFQLEASFLYDEETTANVKYYKWDNISIQEFGISTSDISDVTPVPF